LSFEDEHSKAEKGMQKIYSLKRRGFRYTLIEGFDGKVKVSLRTRNANTYDLGKILMSTTYGGGHKAAAGASIPFRLKKSLTILLSAISQNNPELGEP
jgi:nanoRNase/pAp phosphatase (c-di-AMP/oligoRNAs hydrolase)